MNIILSNTDSAPIYEQITRQLRAKIVSGELAAGQALPSMRLLARELRISVITTKRAHLVQAVRAAKQGGLTAEEFMEIAQTAFEEGNR